MYTHDECWLPLEQESRRLKAPVSWTYAVVPVPRGTEKLPELEEWRGGYLSLDGSTHLQKRESVTQIPFRKVHLHDLWTVSKQVTSPSLCAERTQTLWGQGCSCIEKSKLLKLVPKDPNTSQSWICGMYTHGKNKIASITFSLIICKPLSRVILYEEMRARPTFTHNCNKANN